MALKVLGQNPLVTSEDKYFNKLENLKKISSERLPNYSVLQSLEDSPTLLGDEPINDTILNQTKPKIMGQYQQEQPFEHIINDVDTSCLEGRTFDQEIIHSGEYQETVSLSETIDYFEPNEEIDCNQECLQEFPDEVESQVTESTDPMQLSIQGYGKKTLKEISKQKNGQFADSAKIDLVICEKKNQLLKLEEVKMQGMQSLKVQTQKPRFSKLLPKDLKNLQSFALGLIIVLYSMLGVDCKRLAMLSFDFLLERCEFKIVIALLTKMATPTAHSVKCDPDLKFLLEISGDDFPFEIFKGKVFKDKAKLILFERPVCFVKRRNDQKGRGSDAIQKAITPILHELLGLKRTKGMTLKDYKQSLLENISEEHFSQLREEIYVNKLMKSLLQDRCYHKVIDFSMKLDKLSVLDGDESQSDLNHLFGSQIQSLSVLEVLGYISYYYDIHLKEKKTLAPQDSVSRAIDELSRLIENKANPEVKEVTKGVQIADNILDLGREIHCSPAEDSELLMKEVFGMHSAFEYLG